MRHLDLLTCSAALAATDPCSSMSPEISQSPQGHLKSDFAGRAQQGSRPATEISSLSACQLHFHPSGVCMGWDRGKCTTVLVCTAVRTVLAGMGKEVIFGHFLGIKKHWLGIPRHSRYIVPVPSS
jgi:hypothetical protein